MTNPVLALSMLLGISLASRAQSGSGALPPSNRVFTHADTLRALRTAFSTGRTYGKVTTALAAAAIGMVAYAGSRSDMGGYDVVSGTSTDANGPAYVAILGAPIAITLSFVGPFSWNGNSKKAEQETIRAYEHRLPFSKRVQRRLHAQLERMLMSENAPSR